MASILAFCVPGESYLAVLDALYDVREQIRLIVCRQEGGAAFMAEAYGKLHRSSRHLFRHARSRRDQCRDRRAHRIPGFFTDDSVHRTGRRRRGRARGFSGSRLSPHVRSDGEMGGADRPRRSHSGVSEPCVSSRRVGTTWSGRAGIAGRHAGHARCGACRASLYAHQGPSRRRRPACHGGPAASLPLGPS